MRTAAKAVARPTLTLVALGSFLPRLVALGTLQPILAPLLPTLAALGIVLLTPTSLNPLLLKTARR